jgi:hypothetical protein
MKTIMFIEESIDKGKMIVGFHLCKYNYHLSPKGIIRIARFSNSFSPLHNYGYYGDIYMKNFVKICKSKIIEKKQRKSEKKIARLILFDKLCYYLYRNIIDFL